MLRKNGSLVLLVMGFVFIAVISVPYMWAYQSIGSEYQFGGFLLNPLDGNSYLAKMYLGWQGTWRFYLPYTFQPGNGGYLFLFYIALGHIARIVGSSLQTTYHLARMVGSVALVTSLWHFYSRALSTRRSHWLAFSLALFGSGLGWLASLFGMFTADFWVAEGYPFLSAYANPHFPLGMAIMLWILTPSLDSGQAHSKKYEYLNKILLSGAALILGIILPFGVVIAAVVLVGLAVWEFLEKVFPLKGKHWGIEQLVLVIRESNSWRKLILVLLGGMPILVYELWIAQSDPMLAAWNSQNLTASPMIWDLLLSFSPLILLALPGAFLIWKDEKKVSKTLLLWAGLGLLLLYLPWSLQRRFILGYMIPLAGLAAIGLDQLISKSRLIAVAVICLVILLLIPTNVMIVLGGIQAVQIKEPKIVITREELGGLNWLSSNTKPDALILASPQMGLIIPAYTGRRVLYGHPFETVNASEMEAAVRDLLNGSYQAEEDLFFSDVDYIFFGSRERDFGRLKKLPEYETVFSSGDVQIFEIENWPQSNSGVEE